MYSHDELKSLHGFLRSTAEGNLKNMLVGGRMTEPHLRILLKVVRACNEDEFVNFVESSSFPKVKMNAGELILKESFWEIACGACAKLGLLTGTAPAAPAKKAA